MSSVRGTVSRALASVLAGAMLLTIAACASDEPVATANDNSPAAQSSFPRTVSHAMGTAKIDRAPTRVLALDMTFVDAALTLEANVIGFTTINAASTALPEYFGEARATLAKEAVPVGTLAEPNLEKIASLRPDVIISAKVRHEAIYDELSQIAPTVFSDTTGGRWKENIRLTATALGREDLAEEKIAAYEERAKTVGEAIRARAGKNPTLSVVRFVDGPTRLYKEDTYSGVVLKDAALARPASQQGAGFSTEISEERILDMDADHIFVTTYPDEKGLSAQTQRKFKANPLWGKLTGQLHEVNDLTWMSAVGMFGAHIILDDLAATFGVDPAKR
ncbi:ABC transporter substrate-binding protein [Asanoa siamensis]|uniref:ABC transporter periplasmic component n=1 Tax=Asanoa siamensis TaxID=926357 RepID=A0ABQ4D4T3_9ACTN|nr:iron-siderophore ABC transporter substrate-binding protein [Asanoa siamensis]GIF78545.1 ABC transporter periplasmic component [Asanoa siamensis]